MTLRQSPIAKPFAANRDGFSLNVAVARQSHLREPLQRPCRYLRRPAFCLDRLATDASGEVVLELERPCRTGATHIVFSPEDLRARLAALGPRPGANLTHDHGVLAPNCQHKRVSSRKPVLSDLLSA